MVRAYSADLGRRGYAPATLARKLSTLRGFLRYLTESGDLQADPSRLLLGPRRRRRLPRVLTVSEVERVLIAAGGAEPLALRDRLLLELLYGCGFRSQEAVDLTLDDVDAVHEQIRVRGKGGRTRMVPVGEETNGGSGPLPGARPRPAPGGGVVDVSRQGRSGGASAPLPQRSPPLDFRHSPAHSKVLCTGRRACSLAAHVAACVCDAHAGARGGPEGHPGVCSATHRSRRRRSTRTLGGRTCDVCTIFTIRGREWARRRD